MTLALDDQAALEFVLTLRRRWADTLYPAVHDELAATGLPLPADPAGLAPLVHSLPSYPGFSWLERGSQKMLWRAVTDALSAGAPACSETAAGSTLQLDPNLTLPDWYVEHDIHVQPGGVWSEDQNALVYELGAKLVMMGENDDYAFHRSFVDTAIPKRSYDRIVDLGCGFGKSAWPFRQAFPDAEVIGIDLSAPCLKLAKRRADERGLPLRLIQADATDVPIEAGTTDLVASTMLIHELPLARLPRLFDEAARLLKPGGLLRFLDFQFTGDPFRDLAMIEHGARNNEPFLPPMMQADLVAMAEAAGLEAVRWRPFDERGPGVLDADHWPTRREWHFPWAVLEAEKPR